MEPFVGSWRGSASTGGLCQYTGIETPGVKGNATCEIAACGGDSFSITFRWNGFEPVSIGSDPEQDERAAKEIAACKAAQEATLKLKVARKQDSDAFAGSFEGLKGTFDVEVSEFQTWFEGIVKCRDGLFAGREVMNFGVGHMSMHRGKKSGSITLMLGAGELHSALKDLNFPVNQFGAELDPYDQAGSTLEQRTRCGGPFKRLITASNLQGVWAGNVTVVVNQSGKQPEEREVACEYSLQPAAATPTFPAYAFPYRVRAFFFSPLLPEESRAQKRRKKKHSSTMPLRQAGDEGVDEVIAEVIGIMGRHDFTVKFRELVGDNEVGPLREVSAGPFGFVFVNCVDGSADKPPIIPSIEAWNPGEAGFALTCSAKLKNDEGWLRLERAQLPFDYERAGSKETL